MARKSLDAVWKLTAEVDLSVAALVGRPVNAIAPQALAKAMYWARPRGG